VNDWLKRNLGLDTVALVLHLAITGIVMGLADELSGDDAITLGVLGASLVSLALYRLVALRRRGGTTGLSSGEMAAFRFEEMEQRLAELEASQSRVAELEERLEFTERLLANQPEERLLAPDPQQRQVER
jgi:hypothetical protein